MGGAKTNEPGLLDQFVMDGDTYEVPRAYQAVASLVQSVFASLAGTSVITAPYRGDGLPDRSDAFLFQLPYDIDETNAMTADQVEVLRATPGPHFFADLKQRPYHYTLRAGQQFIYLPREDAYGKWTEGAAAEIDLDGVAQTVVYKNAVVSTDAVPAGEVWIAKTLVQHPDSGRWVAPMKIGDPLALAAELLVKYMPVFRVDVTDVQTDFGSGRYGREDKILSLVEVN